ncbi:hypothetical protein [Epilithonimonas sp.]|uniref:hypothetical protein n=1 Tax=Epilithonimonas sp. TaxID=2894511 RepID=UPI00289F8D74|nr:hypothetical protein [Epilithonimonas sp.]
MKKHFLIVAMGVTLLALYSCRENESLTENTPLPVLELSTLSKKGDSTMSREFIEETDPPKDRDNWRMSPHP